MKVKKILSTAFLLSTLLICTSSIIPAYAAEPHAEIPMAGDFKWVKEDGSFAKNEWIYTTKVYKNGQQRTGWMYFGDDENVKEGWFMVNGKWYYSEKEVDPDTHLKDTYFIRTSSFAPNNSGNLIYYVDSSGQMISNKWQLIDSCWYYFNSNGEYEKNTYIDGYKLDMYGRMVEK